MGNKKRGKQKVYRNNKNLGLELEAKNVIVPILILTFFAVLIGVTVVNQLSSLNTRGKQVTESMSTEDRVWEQAFLEAEKNKVGVIFDPINTTEDEYTQLRLKCNEFIESNNAGKKVDAEVSVDTIVDEKRYIDGETGSESGSSGNSSRSGETSDELDSTSINLGNTKDLGSRGELESKNLAADKVMSETGPIYFQDMITIRYINNEGQLKVITSAFNHDKTEIVVARQGNLKETIAKLKVGGSKKDSIIGEKGREQGDNESTEQSLSESIVEEENWIPEKEYLDGVSNTLNLMLLAHTTDEIREAESLAMNYFTVEGKKTVFGNREEIKLSEGSTINTLYIAAGKSDSSKTYKDRIYTQLKINVGDEEFYTYIILKLNSNLRVYDIDIL